ncbi:hypothetical protein TanjilG_19992 [Lupinus angustifolius]|uniref:Vesicle transport protein n=1 Tax=Lupinus angustifolius TaxID=3871 RepID=A0A394BAA5_LUPAN|nr:hypothetical protein TanjilG_23843 [Lupinus angustifolius]OIW07891.1 hypothetical protein TanjilG_19992 [Lupinus angustifolius]
MNRAFKKVKIMVGMEVEDQEQQAAALEDNNANFMDDFNCNSTLSTIQSMLVFLKPIKFAITFTLGNLLSHGSTALLIGPKKQVTVMLDPVRIYATAIYLANIVIDWYSLSTFARSMTTNSSGIA